jgi:hypothetical protein
MDSNSLEKLHERIIGLVEREIERVEQLEELDEKAIRNIESADKVLRAAIEIYMKKKPKNGLEEKSDEDLLKLFGVEE